MTEVLGAVASVLQLVSVTTKLVQYCTEVAHASAEADELIIECCALTPLLLRLKKDTKLQDSQAARPLLGSFNDLSKRVNDLAEKLRPDSRLRRLSRDVLWPLLKKEMREVMERATQLAGLINSWMTLDIKDLAESIKQDTAVLPDMAKALQKTLSITVQNERRHIREMMNTMVDFFSPVSFSEKQNEIFDQRLPGTGQWFIDSPAFQKWLSLPGATLWCPGDPGSGKTFIASIVVDYLQGWVKQRRETGLTYVYCDFRRRNQEPTTLLANIWTQLILQRELSKTEVDQLDNDLYGRRVKLSTTQLNGLVEKEFTDGKFQRMFVVIDALDECNEAQREALLDHVTRLYPWANVLITSRVLGSDVKRFKVVNILKIASAEVDMHAYIRSRIIGSRKLAENIKRRPDLEDEIVRVVGERSQGLFLLCKLHMNSLALESTPKAVRKVLEGIPVGETAMRDTYKNAVQWIENQHRSNREWAMRTIQWVCFALRPLTSTELTHALAVGQDDDELSKDNIISIDLLVEYCGGLVVIEPETEIVRFVHFTTQEYFEAEKNTALFAGTDASIALTCITFLGFDDPFLNDDVTLPEIRDVQTATPFLEYAAAFFGKHYHKMLQNPEHVSPDVAQDIAYFLGKFFRDIKNVHRAAASSLFNILGRWQVWPGAHQPVRNLNISALDMGAFYGVVTPNADAAPLTVQWFSQHTKRLDKPNRQSFGNALHWAALGDSVDSMKTLLQDPSLNLNTQETNTWAVQPAHVSAVFGSVETLRVLLQHTELNISSRVSDLSWSGTILHLAIRSVGSSVADKIALIDVIVRKDFGGQLILGRDIYEANPLIVAVKESEYPVFQRVLRYFDAVAGESIWKTSQTADRFAKTPLHWAVMDPSFGFKNHTVAADASPLLKLKALLDHPLASQLMWMRDGKNDVPFEEAVRQSNIHAVAYMISKAAEHRWPGFDQLLLSALHLSVEVAHWKVVKLLLGSIGPELLARPDQDITLLHHAARGTSHGAMRFLLKRLEHAGLHNVRDQRMMTPLHIAAFVGNVDAVEALLELGTVEINARDDKEDTPLHLAARNDIGEACAKLLAAGADSSLRNSSGHTPLDVALGQRSSNAVRAFAMSRGPEKKPLEQLDESTARWLADQPWGKHLLGDAGVGASLQYWPQCNGDIVQVALCLRRRLGSSPPSRGDLATYILDLAGYWTKTTSMRVATENVVRQWHDPVLPFLTSLPMRGRVASPARRVAFTIVSHDQGYADDPHAGNWTWFVAEAGHASIFGEAQRDGGGSQGGPIEICKNRVANPDWYTHEIVWDAGRRLDDEDEDSSAEAAWVRSLRPDDAILVKPMVMFAGWQNWVDRVRIDVYTSCLQYSSQTSI